MNRKKLIFGLLVSALAVASIFGVVAYTSARAATLPTIATNRTSNFLADTGRGVKDGFAKEDLADALGITLDELNAAIEKANQAVLTQAVQAGLITQAQADQLLAKGSAFPLGNRWGGWLSENGIDFDALLASELGISVEQLQAAYTQAFNARIDQAVMDGKFSQEQADLIKGRRALNASQDFQLAMQSAFEAAVKQAVADGVITQAQADLILANDNSTRGVGPDFPVMSDPGNFRRPGRHGGLGDGPPGNSAPVDPAGSSAGGL